MSAPPPFESPSGLRFAINANGSAVPRISVSTARRVPTAAGRASRMRR